MTHTRTATNVPIYGALGALRTFAGAHANWNPTNEMQATFLLRERALQTSLAIVPELVTIASSSADEINAFLRARGFTIQLQSWDPTDGCGAAGVLDLALTWAVIGSKTSVTLKETGKAYVAAKLTADGVTIHRAASHEHLVAEIATQTADRVFVTIANPPTYDDLIAFATRIQGSLDRVMGGNVILPMLSCDERVDLSWLIGMHATDDDGPLIVSQALQQTRFRLNERGARAQSGVAVAVRRGITPTLVIDEPFVLWIVRPSLPEPLFVGHFCPDSWTDPGALD